MKARTGVGTGEKSRLSDPGCEFRIGREGIRENKKCEHDRCDDQKIELFGWRATPQSIPQQQCDNQIAFARIYIRIPLPMPSSSPRL